MMETTIFMFCLTVHNIEEALWMPDWRAKTMPRRSPQKEHFIFAVLGITVIGYLSAGLFAFYPDNQHLEYAFVGFTGAMFINAVVPHLALTIRYRKYCPGVMTGCFLIIPLHSMILYNAANSHLKISEILIATLIVCAVLLGVIPLFVRLAKAIFSPR